MQEQEKKLEGFLKAVYWKLYLEKDSTELEEQWNSLSLYHKAEYEEVARKICEYITSSVKRALEIRLSIVESTVTIEDKKIDKIFTHILNEFLLDSNSLTKENKEDLNGLINEFKERFQADLQGDSSSPKVSEPEDQISTNQQTHKVDVAQWKYLPVPENEPEQHSEYDYKSGKTPEGMKIIGARVRGKMHKHQGTNCDDWFEFTTRGNWTVIAVSDGAGSKKFSRVGAKASCQAAVNYLANNLQLQIVKERQTTEELQQDLKRDEKNWAFVGQDIDFVQNCLHEAMKTAYKAIQLEAEEHQDSLRYYKALEDRQFNIKDLSATLLLAVHTTIKVGGNNYNLVLTCQIGDGMLAAISQEGRLKLLGQPDSGEYAGQTEFLTSKKNVEKENLLKKTFVFPGKLRALMVMTDGVADNYFPNDPGMWELYGDLIVNQVINIPKPSEAEISEHLRYTNLGSVGGVKDCKTHFQDLVKRILPDDSTEPKRININSIAKYAAELGKSVAEVVASPALLAAGIMEEGMCDECQDMPPEEQLKIWLDAYYQKGSFDDRTLVVLYNEDV